jgi:hypothetical protein
MFITTHFYTHISAISIAGLQDFPLQLLALNLKQ